MDKDEADVAPININVKISIRVVVGAYSVVVVRRLV
jgi:hypothetical protein